MRKYAILMLTLLLILSCKQKKEIGMISPTLQKSIVDSLVVKFGDSIRSRAEQGVAQASKLWVATDGTDKEFAEFCKKTLQALLLSLI